MARGRSWITTADSAPLLGIPESHVAPALARWRRRGQRFSPTKGLYVVVPPDYQPWGAVPASPLIDALMAHLAGTMPVLSIETTILDLVAHPRDSGGRLNAATIVGEMLKDQSIDVARLAASIAGNPMSVVQRCGWLLDVMANWVQVDLDTEPLDGSIPSRRAVLVDPGSRRAGELDARWHVLVNTLPEPDL